MLPIITNNFRLSQGEEIHRYEADQVDEEEDCEELAVFLVLRQRPGAAEYEYEGDGDGVDYTLGLEVVDALEEGVDGVERRQ